MTDQSTFLAALDRTLCGWLAALLTLITVPAGAQESTYPAPDIVLPQRTEAPSEPEAAKNAAELARSRYLLVEEFTGHTLGAGEFKLGTDLDFGLSDRAMIGTDMIATIIGAPTLQTKYRFHEHGKHQFAFGLRLGYLNRNTILWGSVNDHFERLDIRFVRPALSWTYTLSDRVSLHAMWAQGLGTAEAKLSEKGRERLKDAKNSGAESADSDNQAANRSSSTSFAQRTVQVSSISGMMSDTFVMTGEMRRRGGNKLLVMTRFERTALETLDANNIRLIAAQQWVWPGFQVRLGIGLQYAVISGRDLDGEFIDEVGVLPASDFKFYWRF